MIVIKVNYTTDQPIIKVNYDDAPIYISTTVDATYIKVDYGTGGGGGGGAIWGDIIGTLSDQLDLQAALDAKVPYTGATGDVDLGEYELKAGQIELDQSPTGTAGVAVTRWNDTIGSTETTLKGGNVILKNGVDLVARVVNKVTPNTTLTKASYQAVKVSGAQGQRLAIALAQANNDNNSADTLGLVIETIPTNQEGFIMTVGNLEGINTTGSLQGETWSDGDVLYLSPTIAGRLTNIKPNGSTGHIVVIGYVEYAHAINGKIYVKIMNGWELDELHNVFISSPANNDALIYESATSLWKNKSIATALGYTPGTVSSVALSVPTGLVITSGSPITTSGTIAVGLQSGYSIPTTIKQSNWDDAYTFVSAFPSQTGNSGKYLTTDGSTLSWGTVSTANIYNSDGTLTGNRTVTLSTNTLTFAGSYITVSNNANSGTYLKVSNTTSGTAAQAYTQFESDATSGFLNIGKRSNTFTQVGIINSADSFIENTTKGDISIRNAFSSGKIKLATGSATTSTASVVGSTFIVGGDVSGSGYIMEFATSANAPRIDFIVNSVYTGQVSSTGSAISIKNNVNNSGVINFNTTVSSVDDTRFRIFNNGNVLIQNGGTFTDAGYKLDVNGTGRFTGDLRTDADLYFAGAGARLYLQSGSINISSAYSNISLFGTASWTLYNNTGYIGSTNAQITYTSSLTANVEQTAILRANPVAYGSGEGRFLIQGMANTGSQTNIGNLYLAGGRHTASSPHGNVYLAHDITGAIGSVGVGTNSINASAILQINSTTKGFLPPRMTAAQKTAISTPATGLVIYQTDSTEGLYQYKSTGWEAIGGGGTNIYNSDGTLTGNRVVTMVGNTLSFTGGNVINNERFVVKGASSTGLSGNGLDLSLLSGVGIVQTYNWTSNTWGQLVLGNGGTTNVGVWATVDGAKNFNVKGGMEVRNDGSDAFPILHRSTTTTGFFYTQIQTGTTDRFAYGYSSAIPGFTIYNSQTTAHAFTIFNSTSNVTLGSTTDAGYKLDVQGTARVAGAIRNTGTNENIVIHILNESQSVGYRSVLVGRTQGTVTGVGVGFSVQSAGGVAIGSTVSTTASGVSIGNSSTANGGASLGNAPNSVDGISIGNAANSNFQAIAIGNISNAVASSSSVNSIAIGNFTYADDNSFVAGSSVRPITNIYFGSGISNLRGDGVQTTAAGTSYTINGSGAFGTNLAGGSITIAGGKGTGTGTSGDVIIATASTTTSGTTLQTLTNRASIKGGTGQLILNAYTSSTSFSGTAAGYLAFDSSGNIITTSGTGGGGGGISRSVNVISTTTTAGASASTDYIYLISGTTTLTLPTAVGNTNRYTLKNVGTNTVTINTTSSQTIDGSTSITMAVRYTALDVISDGTNWNII